MSPLAAPGCQSLLHVFSTFAVGGPQIRFVQLAEHFGTAVRHTVLAMDGVTACADRVPPGVPLTAKPAPVRKRDGLRNLPRMRAAIRAAAPDVLCTYNWGAIEWALANRIAPLCRHLHFEDGFGPEEADGRQLARRVWMRRLALSGPATRIVVPSTLLYRIATETWRFPPRWVHLIPNGIDCRRFGLATPSAFARGLRQRPDELLIGSVGLLRPEKNFARLLRVAARLADQPPWRLVLVGDGPEGPALKREARRLGLGERVVFTGRLDRPEEVLAALDLFVLSSDTEQMPYSILEAMATGLPIAATAVGDVPAMVAAENRAFLVDGRDEAEFARMIGTLLRDPGLRRSLGAANRQRVEATYDHQAMFAAHAALLAGG